MQQHRARAVGWPIWLALAGILIIAAQFRFLSLTTWDGTSYLHPDERFIVYTVYNLRVPSSFGDYLKSGCSTNGQVRNPSRTTDLAGRELTPESYEPSLASGCNTLNPRNYGWSGFFVYGTLPTTLTRIVAEWTHRDLVEEAGQNGAVIPPPEIRNTGRMLSALFDLASVFVVFLLARRLYGEWAGLLASGLYACAALPIQLAHFFTVDSATGFFVILSAYWAVRAAQQGGILNFLLLGLSVGGAMASRITMATLGMLAILAAGTLLWNRREQRFETGYLVRLIALLMLSGMVALLSFRVLAPDTFVGTSFIDLRPEPRFVDSITEVSGFVSGEIDAPFSQQWANRTPYLFPLGNMVIWGMGLPLGITAWLSWAAALLLLIWKRDLRHLIPVVWIGFYFAWQGGQFGMTMRYYALLYGLLATLAAWGLLAIWGQAQQYRQYRWRRIARGAPLLIVALGTFLWAQAFTMIYREPHSRIAASRWIYANIPAGAVITSEIWDDPLPLGEDGQNPNQYVILKTAPYQEDDLIKYTGYMAADGTAVPGLIDQLEQADYVILSSNRVYGSALRLPMRYPALTRYYATLFNGQLGFDLVADIHSYPTLFGIEIPDQGAEEAFSVYDHPRVLIFKKSERFNRAEATRLLTAGIAWGEVYKLPTVKVRKVPTALRLTDQDWPIYRTAGTWIERFNQSSITNQVPWLFWLLALQIIGWATFALLFRFLAMLPDRGYAFAKPVGLLLVSFLAWWLSSQRWLQFTPTTSWITLGLLLASGGIATWLQRDTLRSWLGQRWRTIAWAEGLFLLCFAIFALLRAANPDLWNPSRGGEKPHDLAMLIAVIKSPHFPPYDPWFAGGYLNAPYFGLVQIGWLTNLTQILPEVAFNLGVATIASLSAAAAWGIGYNAVASTQPNHGRIERRARISAALAVVLVVFAGTLTQAIWLLPGSANTETASTTSGPWLPGSYAAEQASRSRPEWAFWDAPRSVAYALNDSTIFSFPFERFLFGDLGSESLGIPLQLLILGLILAAFRSQSAHSPQSAWVVLGLLGLGLGALRTTSWWGYTGFLGVVVLSLAMASWLQIRRGAASKQILIWLAIRIGCVLLLAWLPWQGFLNSFAAESGLELWKGDRTPTGEFLQLSGMWIFALASSGALLYHRAGRLSATPLLVILAAAALLIGLTAWSGLIALLAQALLLAGALVLLTDLALLRHASHAEPPQTEAGPRSLLIGLWGILIFVFAIIPELVTWKGDLGRQQTAMATSLQVWLLGGIVAAIALPWAWEQIGRAAGALAWAWRVPLLLIGLASLAYPLSAPAARIADRVAPQTGPSLNGALAMPLGTHEEQGRIYPFTEDVAGIAWLRQNVQGTPIILEGHTNDYRWGGRIAAYTGLPTLVGWPSPVAAQRVLAQAQAVIDYRRLLIEDLYNSIDQAKTISQFQLYGIEYVYVGQLERTMYDPNGIAKFEQMASAGTIEQVFQQGGTAIYRIPPDPIRTAPAVTAITTRVEPPTMPADPNAAMLDRPVGDLPPSDPYPSLGRGGPGEQLIALALWCLIWLMIGALGLPTALLIFGQTSSQHWSDGGWAWARPIGLVLLGYATWLPTSLQIWYYDWIGLLLSIALVLLLNIWLVQRLGGITTLIDLVTAQQRRILQVEGLALLGFVAMLVLRLYNPDLWHPYWGGEKPFEFGLLNAVVRSASMPPYSPFYSDGTINYYYYGFFLVSLAIKATGIAPSVAFNLIIATLFGLFVAACFSLAARISGRGWVGLVAILLVALAGNFAAAFPVGWSGGVAPALAAWAEGPSGFGERLGSWFVGPSRVIPNTINEFPLWGFVFADLHPHLIALPLTLLAIALAFVWFEGVVTSISQQVTFGLSALTIGALAITNSWDTPTYALVLGGALAARGWRSAGTLSQRVWALLRHGLLAILITGVGILLYWPFFQQFRSPVGGIVAVTTPSTLRDYLVVYGLPLALLIPMLLGAGWIAGGRPIRTHSSAAAANGDPPPAVLPALLRLAWVVVLALVIIGGVALTLAPVLLGALRIEPPAWLTQTGANLPGIRIWLVALILACIPLLFHRRVARPTWFAIWLVAVGFAVSLGFELIAIRDHLAGGDWYRMNTVFKFGLQVWVLFGLAAALAFPAFARGVRRAGLLAEAITWPILIILTGLAMLFLAIGIPSRVAYRIEGQKPITLDGLAFLDSSSYYIFPQYLGLPENSFTPTPIELRYDAAAIRWLNENIRGTPVVAQSSAEFYRIYGVRIAANTGLPTIVSPLHEAEQRDAKAVFDRDGDVNQLYRSADRSEILSILQRYRVEYLYVGPIERLIYGDSGADTFAILQAEGIFSQAYSNQQVTIYQVDLPAVQRFLALNPAGGASDGVNSEADTMLRGLELRYKRDPNNLDAAWALALRYSELGRFEDAVNTLAPAAAARPGDVGLQQLYGDMLSRAGQFEAAEAAYRQAIAVAPTAPNYTRLGAEFLIWGWLDEAEQALNQAVGLDPKLPDPYYYLGQIAEERGNRDVAANFYQSYLDNSTAEAPFRFDAEEGIKRMRE
ncbi:MAG: DUF2298 domain-containing protein [Roseiflexaceae bacterium]